MTVSHDIHYYLARIKNHIAPALKFRDEIWTIQIWGGKSPFHLAPLQATRNPVLSAQKVNDMVADFVADPFMTFENGRWYMFFEALEQQSRKGVICLATSDEGHDWTYCGVVLREDFHLSYPYTFKSGDTFYMVPESAQAGDVRLYRSTDFPMRWSFVTSLLTGAHRDPSILHFGGLWWLFSQSSENGANALRLHYASELTGTWIEHPHSPLIADDPHFTRPGGRILEYDGRLYRIAQDTYPEYGLQLFAFEILELTTESYAERLVEDGPILKGKGKGLFRERIHHLDAHQIDEGQWIAAVDHSRRTWAPRFG
jgi:hypothetical protein